MLENEFRVLDLLPTADAGPQADIQCRIRVVNLTSEPVYETLSYRWGSSGGQRSIQVDDTCIVVTDNLYAAILRLRRKDSVRTIWIDQLCIDQQSMEEKTAQVRLMKQIYFNCTQTVIWMDEIDTDIPQTDAEAILDVLRWMVDQSLPVPSCVGSWSDFQGPLKALASISTWKHPWWDRIWTVQEAILPSQKTFIWGPLQISWELLTSGSRVWTRGPMPDQLRTLMVQNRPKNLSEDISKTMGWLFCNVIWINSAHIGPSLPTEVIVKWGRRKATNPRDKVFGVLGLLPPSSM